MIPLLTAHWIDLLGLTLIRELSSDRQLAWKLADFGLALAAQFALGLIAWVALRWGRVAGVAATAVAWLPMAVLVNQAYLVAIPSRFLIEADPAAEVAAWPEACAVDGMLASVAGGVSRGLERRGEALLRLDGPSAYAILRAATCTSEPVAVPDLPIAPGVIQVTPAGGVVYSTQQRGESTQTFWWLPRGASTPRRLDPPPGHDQGAPIVSEEGSHVAWVVRSATRTASIHIESLGDAPAPSPLVFDHDLLQQTTLVVVELEMASRSVVVNRDLRTFVALQLDGGTAWGPLTPPVAAQGGTFRYAAGQWLAWDAYVEDGRYRAAWSTGPGSAQYEVPLGRSISAAALDARGRFAAVSTSTALNIGAIKDTVIVMRTSDRAERVRRSLATYTRSEVAFLGDEWFAYSNIEGDKGRTHILRIVE